jgi:hypothetical protein
LKFIEELVVDGINNIMEMIRVIWSGLGGLKMNLSSLDINEQ